MRFRHLSKSRPRTLWTLTSRSTQRWGRPSVHCVPRARAIAYHRGVWIVAGERSYGRVAECGNEFVQTRFAHVWFLPLVPITSQWAHGVGYATCGFEIRTDARSVAATYLR